MERLIQVTVRVSNEEHSKLIKKDIEECVKMRTSIYHISKPITPILYIEELYKKVV